MTTNYSDKNESLHANVKWLKPQLQAAYARWESGETAAYEDWTNLMNEEMATAAQVRGSLLEAARAFWSSRFSEAAR